MPYWSLNIHLVWTTKHREPVLHSQAAMVAERSPRATCREHKAVVHALRVMPDHVHIAVSVPPAVAVATLVARLKGSSSHLMTRAQEGRLDALGWQSEDGAVSFGGRQPPDVVRSIEDQEQRPAERRLWDKLERWESEREPAPAGLVGEARGLSLGNGSGGDA